MKDSLTRVVAKSPMVSFVPRFSKKCNKCKRLISGTFKEVAEHLCTLQEPQEIAPAILGMKQSSP